MQARYEPATITVFGMTDIRPEDKTMDMTKVPKWTMREISADEFDGTHRGMLGVFDGNELKGFIDEPSYMSVRRNRDGATKSDTAKLMEFIKTNIAVLGTLPEALAVPVAEG